MVDCEFIQLEQSSSRPVTTVIMIGHVAMGKKRHNKYKILMTFQGAMYTLGGKG